MTTVTATAPAALIAGQFRFFRAEVARVRPLGPGMVRITLHGADLRDFAGGGRDQSFSLFLPHPGQEEPLVPIEAGAGWFAGWRALDPQVRAVMRSYTVRAQRPEAGEVDVDFALHGLTGPASRWAGRARGGERVVLLGPAVADNRSVGFRPAPSADWTLLAGDESALPAIGAILAGLPAGAPVRAWIEVSRLADMQALPTCADAEVTWLFRDAGGTSRLAGALRTARWPAGTPYAWLAGECGVVRDLRRHLVNDRGVPRRSITFSGYWRRGASEEDLRAEAAD